MKWRKRGYLLAAILALASATIQAAGDAANLLI